jgi:hypothetical protein
MDTQRPDGAAKATASASLGAAAAAAGKPGVYNPRARRAELGLDAGTSMNQRDNSTTLRVMDLPEGTTEDDLRVCISISFTC